MDNKELDRRIASRMAEQCNTGDVEADHSKAEDMLCFVLKELGFTETVTTFNNLKKWYA